MESIRLKYIAKIDMGQSPSSSDYTTENDEDGIPFLQGTAEFGEKYPTPVVYTTQANKIADEGDILFSVRAPVGQININKDKVGIGRGLCAIKANNKTSQDYLWWVLHASRGQLKLLETGTTYAAVSVEDISNMIVPLHEKSKQNKIVAYLDQEVAKIDALIEKKSRLVELLEEKKKATISQAVTKGLNPKVKLKPSGIDWLGDIPEHWEVNKISRVFSLIGSGTTPNSSNISYYAEGDLPWLNTGDLNDEYIYETSKHITQLAVDDHSTLKLFPEDSLVIAMYGATIGKTALTKIACYTNQACCVLNNSKLVSTRFAQFYFISIKETLVNLSNGGGQPNISQGIIRDFMIGYPSLNEQNEIITFLDKKLDEFQELNTKINNSIDLLKEKRTAIISAAINGEINL